MTTDEMIRGLVRAAEGQEQRDGGAVWDDEVRLALEEARRRGWGLNGTGTTEADRVADLVTNVDLGKVHDDACAELGLPCNSSLADELKPIVRATVTAVARVLREGAERDAEKDGSQKAVTGAGARDARTASRRLHRRSTQTR